MNTAIILLLCSVYSTIYKHSNACLCSSVYECFRVVSSPSLCLLFTSHMTLTCLTLCNVIQQHSKHFVTMLLYRKSLMPMLTCVLAINSVFKANGVAFVKGISKL